MAAWIAGPDQILGNGTWRFDHDMLVDKRAFGLERRWKEGVNVNLTQDVGLYGLGQVITSGGEWILRGSVEVV